MSPKYSEYSPQAHRVTQKEKIHPIWRGVGFTMIVLIPIISYAAADVLLRQNGLNNWFPIPRDLIAHRGDFFFSIFRDPMIHIRLLLLVLMMCIFYLVFMLITFLISSAFGTSGNRRDPYYVPPVQRRRRRRI